MRGSTLRGLVLSSAVAGVMAVPAFAATSTWVGGTNLSWNEPLNWDSGKPSDVAAIGSSLANGATVSLDAGQAINELSIGTINGFTIGTAADKTAGYTLSLSKVTRQDVSGTENNHTIAAPVALTANSIWDISGSGVVSATGGVSGAGYGLTKRGAGTLTISATDSTYSGQTIIEQGAFNIGRKMVTTSALPLIVGGAGQSATAKLNADSAWNSSIVSHVLVKPGGTLDQNGRVTYLTAVTIEGGSWLPGQVYPSNNQTWTLKSGALVSGGYGVTGWSYNGTLRSTTDSTSTSTWATALGLGNSYDAVFDIQDGAGYVDLIISSAMTGSSANQLKKTGTGVLQLTGSSNAFNRPVNITAGTLLVDNTTAGTSATGQGVVTISAGATLGGAGYIGGGYSTAAINLSNGTSSSRATIAPGSIGNTTGDALIGTLAVGTAAQANNVTFGTYAQLLSQVGNVGSNDRLTIYGDLNLAAANDLLSIQQVSGTTLAGEYTLASFTGTLTGRFDGQTLNGGSLGTYQLQYRNSAGTPILTTDPITGGGSVVLSIPEPASATLALASLVGALAFRRRSI